MSEFELQQLTSKQLILVGLIMPAAPGTIKAAIAKQCREELFRRTPGAEPKNPVDEQ